MTNIDEIRNEFSPQPGSELDNVLTQLASANERGDTYQVQQRTKYLGMIVRACRAMQKELQTIPTEPPRFIPGQAHNFHDAAGWRRHELQTGLAKYLAHESELTPAATSPMAAG